MKKIVFFLMAVLPLVLSAQRVCQVSSQIGNPEFSSDTLGIRFYPVDNFYNYSFTETLIENWEINGGPQTINSISFYYVGANPMTAKTNCTIYLAHSYIYDLGYNAADDEYYHFYSSPALTRASQGIRNDTCTMVYTGSLNCTQQGWNTFEFDTPFNYNGEDNLVVIVDDNSGDYDVNGFYYKFLQDAVHIWDTSYFFTQHHRCWSTSAFSDGNNPSIIDYDDSHPDPLHTRTPGLDIENCNRIKTYYRPVMRLDGTKNVSRLPYRENFESLYGSVEPGKPLDWTVVRGTNYKYSVTSWDLDRDPSPISGERSFVMKAMNPTNVTHSVSTEFNTPWFALDPNTDSIRISLKMRNPLVSYGYSGLHVDYQKSSWSAAAHSVHLNSLTGVRNSGSFLHDHDNATLISVTIPLDRVEAGDSIRFRFRPFSNVSREDIDFDGYIVIDDLEIEGISVIGDVRNQSAAYTVPVNTYFKYSLNEMIVDAEELGAERWMLNSISFYYDTTMPLDLKSNCSIYIQPTNRTIFFSDYDMEMLDPSAVLVYQGALDFQTRGWKTFDFVRPFYYDGTSNLMIIIDDNSGVYSPSHPKFRTSPCVNKTLSYYSDAYNPDLTESTYQGNHTRLGYRPLMHFGSNPVLDLAYSEDLTSTLPDRIPDGWSKTKMTNPPYDWKVVESQDASGRTIRDLVAVPTGNSSEYTQSIYTPWFILPDNADGVKISYMVKNPRVGSRPGRITKIGASHETYQYALDLTSSIPSYLPEEIGTQAHTDWETLEYTLTRQNLRLESEATDNPFRFQFYPIQDPLNAAQTSSLYIKDINISLIRNNSTSPSSPYIISEGEPYSETFDNIDELEDIGWDFRFENPLSIKWELVSAGVEDSRPMLDHRSLVFQNTLGSGAESYVCSPWMKVWTDSPRPNDSITLEFLYYNPEYHLNSIRPYIMGENTGLSQFRFISQASNGYTKYRASVPLRYVNDDAFYIVIAGSPSDGQYVLVDSVKVSFNSYRNIETVVIPANAGVAQGGGRYPHYSSFELNATPAEGYAFQYWFCDGHADTNAHLDDLRAVNDRTYVAVFAPVQHVTDTVPNVIQADCPQKTISFFVNSSRFGRLTHTTLTLPVGSSTEVMALPNPGFKFVHWGDGNTDNPRTIVFDADAPSSFSALFQYE